MDKPYCISREEGKLILSTQFLEDSSITDESQSEEDSDDIDTSIASERDSEKSGNSDISDNDYS